MIGLNSLPTIPIRLKKPDNPQMRAYEQAVEKGMKSQYVIPENGGWIVKQSNVKNYSKVFATQQEAVSFAKKIAQSQGADVFVYNSEGYIKQRIYCKE